MDPMEEPVLTPQPIPAETPAPVAGGPLARVRGALFGNKTTDSSQPILGGLGQASEPVAVPTFTPDPIPAAPAWPIGANTEPTTSVQPAGNHDFGATQSDAYAVPTFANMTERSFSSATPTTTVTSETSTIVPPPLPEDPFAPKTESSPVITTFPAPEAPEPSPIPEPAVSPVWTPDAVPAPAGQPTTLDSTEPNSFPTPDADIPPASDPSVEPTTTTIKPEAELIKRSELPPELILRIKEIINEAIESGAFDNLAKALKEPSDENTTVSSPNTNTIPNNPMAQTESDALRTVNQGTLGNPIPPRGPFS